MSYLKASVLLALVAAAMAQSDGCTGGFVAGTSGQFASPYYPSNYPNSVSCDWFIEAPAGTRVSILIADMNTESGYDGVIIRDGWSGNSPLLLDYSGSATNVRVESDANLVFVGFYSDSSINNYRGFNLTWTAM